MTPAKKTGGDVTQGRAERGFAIAPILYLLGMIGVGAGLLFSSYSQILRSNQTMANMLAAKNDLQGTATTLAATSWLSTDGTKLCPPLVGSNSPNVPSAVCSESASATTVGATLASATALPANAASISTAGAPVEVGVFAAGHREKVLDPWGHNYLYCRWENGIGGANALMVISAGPHGRIATTCGGGWRQSHDRVVDGGDAEPRRGVANDDGGLDRHRGAVREYGLATQHRHQRRHDGAGEPVGFGHDGHSGNERADRQRSRRPDGQRHHRHRHSGCIGACDPAGGLERDIGQFFGDFGGYGVDDPGELSAGTSTLSSAVVSVGGTLGVTGASTFGAVTEGATASDNLTVANASFFGGNVTTSTAEVQIGTAVAAGSPVMLLTVGKGAGTPAAYPFSVDQDGNVTGGTFTGSFSGNLTGSQSGGSVSATSLSASGSTSLAGPLNGSSAIFTGSVQASSFTGALNLSGGGSITGIVPIANGGTGANTAGLALTGLVAAAANGIGNFIPGSYLESGTVTALQLNSVGTPGTYSSVTVGADGRVYAGTPLSANGLAGNGSTGYDALWISPTTIGTGLIYESGGKVGIGTTSPGASLEVYGSGIKVTDLTTNTYIGGAVGINIVPPDVGVSTEYVGLALSTPYNSGTALNSYVRNTRGTSNTYIGMELGTVTNHPIRFLTNSTGENVNERMRIDTSGNVGIGTTAPGSTLQVNGNAAIGYSTNTAGPNNGLAVSGTVTIGATTVSTIGALQVNGTIGLAPNSQVRQWTYLDGGTLAFFGTQFVAGINNSDSYSYAGGGIIAAETNLDGTLLLDIGRASGAAAFQINNTISRQISLNLRNALGSSVFYASTNTGNVGIGTTNPGAALEVNGQVKVDSWAAASATAVCQNGNILSSCSSSRRYKESIVHADFGLKETLALQPVTFKWKGRDEQDFGLIAEDVAKINPLFVSTGKDGQIEGPKYPQLTAVLAGAIKEMKALFDSDHKELVKLKGTTDNLTAQLKAANDNIEGLKAELKVHDGKCGRMVAGFDRLKASNDNQSQEIEALKMENSRLKVVNDNHAADEIRLKKLEDQLTALTAAGGGRR